MEAVLETLGVTWRQLPSAQFEASIALALASLGEQVCIPAWSLVLTVAVGFFMVFLIWLFLSRSRGLVAMLEQISEDSTSLAELFGSELERLRGQLSQSKEDSESLDEILASILQGGLPGQLEMVSKDYWCVKTMQVSYTDHEGTSHNWSQSGYHVSCFVPGGARNIQVTFGVVGGAEVRQVDRSDPDFSYILDANGRTQTERFVYARCPNNAKFEIRGPSLGAFITQVTETDGRLGAFKKAVSASRSCS